MLAILDGLWYYSLAFEFPPYSCGEINEYH